MERSAQPPRLRQPSQQQSAGLPPWAYAAFGGGGVLILILGIIVIRTSIGGSAQPAKTDRAGGDAVAAREAITEGERSVIADATPAFPAPAVSPAVSPPVAPATAATPTNGAQMTTAQDRGTLRALGCGSSRGRFRVEPGS